MTTTTTVTAMTIASTMRLVRSAVRSPMIPDEIDCRSGARADRLTHRLICLINDTRHLPATGRAVRESVWLLAIRSRACDLHAHYAELCASYVRIACGVAIATAARAWKRVLSIVEPTRCRPTEARERGAPLRDLSPGRHWGSHLILTDEQVTALRRAARIADQDRTPTSAPPSSLDCWRRLDVIWSDARGRARCPWHDDRVPSATVNQNAHDPDSGSWVCHACIDDHGDRLTGYWRRLPSGEIRARVRLGGSGVVATRSEAERIERRSPTSPVLSVLSHRGLRSRRSRCGSLLAALRRSEVESTRPAAWVAAHGASAQVLRGADPRSVLPERLIHASCAQPTDWKPGPHGGAVPIRWAPTSQRWILMDLDDFESAPTIDSRVIEQLRSGLDRVAEQHDKLSGEVAAVETSPTGLQVWLQLETEAPSARAFFRSARSWIRRLAGVVLEVVRGCGWEGGHADPAAWSAGRMGRRPGWRLVDGLWPHRCRLLHASEG